MRTIRLKHSGNLKRDILAQLMPSITDTIICLQIEETTINRQNLTRKGDSKINFRRILNIINSNNRGIINIILQ